MTAFKMSVTQLLAFSKKHYLIKLVQDKIIDKMNEKNTLSNFFKVTLCGILCFTLVVCEAQQTASIQARVVINTNTPAKKYDPMIFGGFLEHFGK